LRVLDGVVLGECRPKRDTKHFVHFLGHVEQATAADQAIHVILDNLSTHKSPPVQRRLRRHPRVHFHFIPIIWTKDADMILDKIAKCPKPLTA
jgi:ribosomal protein S17